MPRGYRRIHSDPRLTWCFPVGLDGDRGDWQGSLIAGKVLGGTSSINSMLYVRGQSQDYNGWASSGAPGWSWKDVAPCFKRIEDHELGESDTRGAGGPLHISSRRCRDAVCAAMGLPRKDDLNVLDQEGIGYFAATIKNGL